MSDNHKGARDAQPRDRENEEPVQEATRQHGESTVFRDPQEDKLLEHAYDGIQEYDNPLPAWWTNMFWATIVFAIGYVFWFHIKHPGDPVMADYRAEVAAAESAAAKRAANNPVNRETLAALMNKPAATQAGQTIFQQKCSPCHGNEGGGNIGPNLTDHHWLHGKGTLMDIHKVVAKGVPAKGMPAWKKQLSPMELQKVVAFVGSIRGKNVEGKAPEGTRVSAK